MSSSSPIPVTQRTARLVPQPDSLPSPPTEVVHISSFAIAKNKHDRILLLKRLRPQFTAGKWTLPSSLIDYGEHPEGAMKRILEVQMGKRPERIKLIEVQSYGDKHWDLCFLYEVEFASEDFRLSQDIEKAEYFDVASLPQELRQDHREVLETAHLI